MFNFSFITKSLKLALLVQQVKKTFNPTETPVLHEQNVRDTTTLTEYHKKIIRAEYAAYLVHNRTSDKKMTSAELARLLNKKLQLNKSVRSYARVWNSED